MATNGNRVSRGTWTQPVPTKQDRISELETRYVTLLEKKIEALEAQVQKAQEGSKKADEAIVVGDVRTNGETNEDSKTTTTTDGEPNNNKNGSGSDQNKGTEEKKDDSTEQSTKAQAHSRVKYRKSKYTEAGIREETDTSPDLMENKPDEASTHAVEILRYFNEDNKYETSTLKILDHSLGALVLSVLSHDPACKHLSFDSTIWFYSPYEPIVNGWSLFEDVVSQDPSKTINKKLRDIISKPVLSPVSFAPVNKSGLSRLGDEKIFNTAVEDLKHVMDVVQATPEIQSFFKGGRDTVFSKQTVSWDLLWTIFPSGTEVIGESFMKQDQLFIVEIPEASWRRESDKKEFWVLWCWAYDYKGSKFDRVLVDLQIQKYKGEKPINTLEFYPLRYHPRAEKLREELVERGKKFCDYSMPKEVEGRVFDYDGIALSRGEGFRKLSEIDNSQTIQEGSSDNIAPSGGSNTDSRRIMINDRCIVDFQTFYDHGPIYDCAAPIGDEFQPTEPASSERCTCDRCAENESLRQNQKIYFDGATDRRHFEELQYAMLPPRVLGYWLSRKRWVELDVRYVSIVKDKTNDSSFQKLQMSKNKKQLIRDLVKNHASGNGKAPMMTDLNNVKGRGLVILLHGPPGVGKTSTAESIASATGKPLLPISVSDIGLEPAVIERKFGILFELAAVWQAILLFDEADVFLESRSNNTADLQRNALVSILLRALEYFSGILILTTNRIKTLDIAVQSRINFAIRFPNLSSTQKKAIYKSFVVQLKDANADTDALLSWIDEEDHEEHSPFKNLNGRQVRNVLFSAATLASGPDGRGRLTLDHIKKILQETREFQEHINFHMEQARKEAEVAYTRNEF